MSEQLSFDFQERPTIKGFPELRWTGKRPYRSTQYYPAQLRERYGEERDGWINRIYWGDNLQVMSHLMKEFRGEVALIYIDPPFDSKADYKKRIEIKSIGEVESDSTNFEEKQYGDIWTNDEYLQFMYERLILCRELLANTGSIYLHCDWHKSHHLRMIMDEVFGPDNFVNEIVWTYRTGGGSKRWFSRKHDTLLYYSKTANYYFNPLKERSYLSHKYGFTNVKIYKDEDGRHYTMAAMRDFWDIDALRGNQPESVGYPTQKPEAILERCLKASSKPGDIVFDCFMGSGTTQAVAMKLGRRFIGADINLGAIHTTTKRLLSIATEFMSSASGPVQLSLIKAANENNGEVDCFSDDCVNLLMADSVGNICGGDEAEERFTQEITPFTGFEVYNVNNYDFFRNPIEARDLLIEALEIQPFPQSNIWDGELDGRMVKIMPVNRIASKADLEELKANLPYKTYEKRKEENPRQAVEKITIICMGHEPDLKASLEADLSEYELDIEIVDILRDKADLQLKRDSEADIIIEDGQLIIRAFYPLNLMQKLSLQKEFVEDWHQLVESVMIDWNYDGAVMQPSVMDVPDKKEMVKGVYDIPKDAGTVKIKITDLLSDSLEMEIRYNG